MVRLTAALLWLACAGPAMADDAEADAREALPPGAVLRLGSLRWRASGPVVMSGFRKGGRELLTVGEDRVATVWDAENGRELRHFTAAGGVPNPNLDPGADIDGRFALSADGRVLAAVGRDRMLRVWDVDTGRELRRFENVINNNRLAVSPDGKLLAVYAPPGLLRVWDVTRDDPPRELSDPPPGRVGCNYVYRLEFGPDGRTLVQTGIRRVPGGVSPIISVWDVAEGKRLHLTDSLPDGAPNNAVLRALPAPDFKTLLLPLDASAVLMDLADGKELRRLKSAERVDASAFAFTPGGKELVQVIGRGEAIVVWDVASGDSARKFGKLDDAATTRAAPAGVSVSPDGRTLAWADGTAINLVDLHTGQSRGGNEGHSTPLMGAYYAPDGRSILTRANRSFVRWDARSGKFMRRYDAPADYPTCLLSRDAKWLVATGRNLTLHVLDTETGKERASVAMDGTGSYTFTVAPDSATLIVLGRPAAALQIFDLFTGEKRHDLPLPPPQPEREEYPGSLPRRLATTPDGRFVAGSTESHLIVWDLAWRRELQRLPIPRDHILRHVAFGPEGRTVAVEFYGGEIGVYELATGTRRRLLTEGARERGAFTQSSARLQLDGSRLPAALAYSPDGRLAANAGTDRTIRVWDVFAARELGSFGGHGEAVTSVSFSPDSTRLVSACADTSALVWDLTPLRAKLQPLPSPPGDAARAQLWARMKDNDAEKAFDALLTLAGDPAGTLPLLRERLKPVAGPDEKVTTRLVADLDAAKYATRQKAKQELERLGDLAIPSLKQALETSGSAEVRTQSRRLLEALSQRRLTAEQVRQLRAVEALELAATPGARALLKALADGAPAAALTIEARLALDRLDGGKKE